MDTDAKGQARNSPGAEPGPWATVLSLSPQTQPSSAPSIMQLRGGLWWPVVAEAAAPWEETADSRTRAAKAQASRTRCCAGK